MRATFRRARSPGVRPLLAVLPGVLGAIAGAAPAFAQDAGGSQPSSDREEAAALLAAPDGEITVTATRTRRDSFDLPWGVTTVTRDEVEKVGSFVAMKALSRRNAAIWYDERTGTTTDLIIRGFAGYNLLTLVDGNTLSTLWGEGGFGADDMFGKIDPEIVERIEVVRGPAAALYGSNALGAVVNVITRSAPASFLDDDSGDGPYRSGGRVRITGATNNDAVGARLEGWAVTRDVRILAGGSSRDFGDVRGGGDLGVLEPSGGRERNWDLSGEWRVSEKRTLRATVQDVHRDHIKRYYRPFQDNENDRQALALTWTDETRTPAWDRLEARLYWQKKVDRRRFFTEGPGGSVGPLDKVGVSTTETVQGGVTASKRLGSGLELTAGFSVEMDDGDSPDDEQFTYVYPGAKRRDAPLSRWWDGAVFVLDEWRLSDAFSLIGSARAGRMEFSTDVDRAYSPAIGNPQDDDIRDATTSLTGGLGGVWRARPDLHIVADWSRGFRQSAPNFGLRQLGDGILVPNGLLDATTSDNFEIGAKGRSEGLRWEVFTYLSKISNWQGDLRPATFGGSSFLDFNDNGSRDANEGYVQQVEGGAARVYGIELSASVHPHTVISSSIPPQWSLWASYARNFGNVDPTATSPLREPLRHTQPTRLLTGVRWDDTDHPSSGLYVELVADFVDRYSEIPTDRIDGDLAWHRDPQDGSSPLLRAYGGTPGYTVLSIYGGVNLNESTTLRLGVENLTDKKYRSAHSRMDAPGIGAVASLEIRF